MGYACLQRFDKRGEGFQLNILLILLTPIIHSKPVRAMIPGGVITGTDIGVAPAITTKPGDPLSSPSVAAS